MRRDLFSVLRQFTGRSLTLMCVMSSLFFSACEEKSAIKTSQLPQLLIAANNLKSDAYSDLVVVAKDAKGKTVTAYTGTVRFTSTDPYSEFPASYTFTVKDAGTKKFPVKFKTAGNQTISIYDTRSTTQTLAKIEVTVGAGSPKNIVLTGHPVTTQAGISNTVLAAITDSFGNVVSDYVGTVAFASSDSSAVLPANYTFTLTDAGAHSFPISFQAAGTQSFTVTDTADELLTNNQSGITVRAGVVQNFSVASFPSSVGAGSSNTVTVTAKDAFGNIANDYTGTIHLSSSDPSAVLPSDYTFVEGDLGIKTFTINLRTSGAQSIIAIDTVSSATGGQVGIIVNPGTATILALSGYPVSASAGTSSNFGVTAKDIYGNTATSYLGTVHFTSSDSIAVLPSNYTFVTGDAGVKSFSGTLKTSGLHSITVTDTVAGSM
ncbi:MAG: hypothetical protein ABIQ95_11005, partial [Bdellovibrionia bacterium]